MSTDSVATAWDSVAENPDLAEDLGYLLMELEFISSATGSDQIIVLPKDESLLKEDAFLVADAKDIADLSQWT
jgi:hypothetical protein